jgi:aspartyl-tRNA(Asn)/glutamyl-tRNA(Gln) amidotransferase subunit B
MSDDDSPGGDGRSAMDLAPERVAPGSTATMVAPVAADQGDGWEMVVGLEVHVELATATKLFCGCPNAFGSEPNTNVCPVCLGLPGSLPVLNERAVEFALRVAEALHLEVPERSIFHRKNYFYPDMPKDFQTSQFDLPITQNGWLEVDGERIRIERAHLEEDTGKSTHVGGGGRIHDAEYSLVDYNRAGVPLLEIVGRPDIRTAEQAMAYVRELRSTLEAIGVSDVKMEEGSMRVDANVSVRRAGSTEFGTRCEIKNLNSVRSLGRAVEYERARQIERLSDGERVIQETRHWDEGAGRTQSLRNKEMAFDYRYFPEPDLVPVAPSEELRASVRASMPELPAARRSRLVSAWGISESDSRTLVERPELAVYAEAAIAAGGVPKDVVNICLGGIAAWCNEHGVEPGELLLPPDGLAELLGLVAADTISSNQAKTVLTESLTTGARPAAVVEAQGMAQVTDEGALGAALDSILAAHPDEVARYRAGDDKERKKLRGFLMGAAMKELKGQGKPQVLNQLLDAKLEG